MDQQVTYDRIMQTAMGFWASKTLMSAVELGIFDALASGPLNATALGLRLGIHERSASDFFDPLVAQGLLQRDNAGLYTNSPEAARFLDRAKPSYIGGIIEMFNARLYGFWGSLTFHRIGLLNRNRGPTHVQCLAQSGRPTGGIGSGPLTCVGLHLARLEMHAIFSALATRVNRFRIQDEARNLNNVLHGFGRLIVSVE